MYIISLHFLAPVEKVNEHRVEHLELLKDYFAVGKAVAWGRKQNPENGGIVLCDNMNRAEVNAFIEKDPYHKYNLAEYEVIEVAFSTAAERLEGLLG